MNRPTFRLRHVVGAASLSCAAIMAGISVLPVAAQTAPMAATSAAVVSCPQLSVGNPNPGDTLSSGGYVITGQAFDPAAQSGAGISSVDFFLGARDQGGMFLGRTTPGSDSSRPRAFSVEVTLPSNFDRDVEFVAYAHSSVAATETTVSFPIFVGNRPNNGAGLVTPTPTVNPIPNVTNNCAAGAPATSASAQPAAAATSMPMVSATPGAMTSTGTTASSMSCPTLSLANPNPGATLFPGGLVISGTASTAGATSGSGVQRVDLFLGARDQGGFFLGSAVPGMSGNPAAFSLEVTIPSNFNRGVDFAAYAIGSNGQEQVVTFPVFVGSPTAPSSGAATPTPVPTTQTVSSTCH